jgi:hypothetical protein
MEMNQSQSEPAKQTAKALGVLIVLGIASRWAPNLSALLVIVVMLQYAGYAWRALANLPTGQVAELLAVVGFALGVGFLAELGVAPLILTGAVLLVVVPLWRVARNESEPGTGDPS